MFKKFFIKHFAEGDPTLAWMGVLFVIVGIMKQLGYF